MNYTALYTVKPDGERVVELVEDDTDHNMVLKPGTVIVYKTPAIIFEQTALEASLFEESGKLPDHRGVLDSTQN